MGPQGSAGRYARQVRLAPIGEDGQRRIRAAHVLVVGCGALGTAVSELLARAGVGTITLVDRDVVEWSNLQRQFLFDEEDARRGLPKVEAAKARLGRINADVRVRSFFDDFNPSNAERYAEGVDVAVDGLDNLETRYLLNDVATLREFPYIYGAAVATDGMSATLVPGRTACLRCLFPEPPPAGSLPTCESAGVLGAATALVASIEAAEAVKLIVGGIEAVSRDIVSFDLWRNLWRRTSIDDARDPECPCCGRKRFEFLDGSRFSEVTVLCGRNAVQFAPPRRESPPPLEVVERRLVDHDELQRDASSVTCRLRGVTSPDGGPIRLTVHADGRVVVGGVREPELAKSIVARFVGR